MGFAIYRERRLPEGFISFSVGVTWEDGSCSHEEITIPEEQCEDEQEVKRLIRETLREWKRVRPKRRTPAHVKAERAKEVGKLGAQEPW